MVYLMDVSDWPRESSEVVRQKGGKGEKEKRKNRRCVTAEA
jgi:hypothetical protein